MKCKERTKVFQSTATTLQYIIDYLYELENIFTFQASRSINLLANFLLWFNRKQIQFYPIEREIKSFDKFMNKI